MLDFIDARFHLQLGGLVHQRKDFGDALEVGGGFRHQQAADAVKALDLAVAMQHALHDGVGVFQLQIFQADELADEHIAVGHAAQRRFLLDGHALGGRLVNLHHAVKPRAQRYQREVVHGEQAVHGLQHFGAGEFFLRLEGEGGGDTRRLDHGAAGQFGVAVEQHIQLRFLEIKVIQLAHRFGFLAGGGARPNHVGRGRFGSASPGAQLANALARGGAGREDLDFRRGRLFVHGCRLRLSRFDRFGLRRNRRHILRQNRRRQRGAEKGQGQQPGGATGE